MLQEIYIIDNDEILIEILKNLFRNEPEYQFKIIDTKELDVALRNIPAMIIINEEGINVDTLELCEQIRSNEDNSITPIVVLSENREINHTIGILKNSIEYYLVKPINEKVLYYTIKNMLRLLYTNRRVSPLTGLPGNVQIQAEIKKRLLNKDVFGVLYFDLDNFKAYNDVYGFSNGDEIIKFTAKTIFNHVHNLNLQDCFVGHIGGDDFVAIVGKIDYEKLCKDIIDEFDENVLNFFTDIDKERGFVEVANRRGIIEQFPLTSISIGVVEIEQNAYESTLEIGEIGAQVKHQAKTIMGSSYIINRRKK